MIQTNSNVVTSNAVVLIEELSPIIQRVAILANTVAVVKSTEDITPIYKQGYKIEHMRFKDLLKKINVDKDLKNAKQVIENLLTGSYTLDNADDAAHIITVNKNGFKIYRKNKPVESACFDDKNYIHLHEFIFKQLPTFNLHRKLYRGNRYIDCPVILEEFLYNSDSFMSYIKTCLESSVLSDEKKVSLIPYIGDDIRNHAELLAVVRDFIIKYNCPELAVLYCEEMEDDLKVRQVIIDAGDAEWAYQYCYRVGNDVKVRQIIIDTGSAYWAHSYCKHISNDDDMKQVIIESGDADIANKYCACITNDDAMKKIVLASESPKLVLAYHTKHKDKQSFDVFKNLVSKAQCWH